jgi:hypothetical protein
VAGGERKPHERDQGEHLVRRHNDQPEILASSLPPSSISIIENTRTMVQCPDPGCCAWVYVQRRLLKPHHILHTTRCQDPDQRIRKVRCPASGQRIRLDLKQDEHLALLYKVRHAADNRRPTHVHLVPAPPPAPPVCRLGQATP